MDSDIDQEIPIKKADRCSDIAGTGQWYSECNNHAGWGDGGGE